MDKSPRNKEKKGPTDLASLIFDSQIRQLTDRLTQISKQKAMTDFHFKNETYELISVALEVHNELGPGFLEAVYQEAFELELINRKIPYEWEKILNIYYKNEKLKKRHDALQ